MPNFSVQKGVPDRCHAAVAQVCFDCGVASLLSRYDCYQNKLSIHYDMPATSCFYFNQPRFLKYHMGPTALVTMSTRA